MFKDVLNHANLVLWAEMGLLIFFAVFVMTVVWAMTRPKRQIEEWSAIPLGTTRDDQAQRRSDGGSGNG